MSDAYAAWQKAVKDIEPADLLRLTEAFAANPGVDDVTFVLDADRWLKRRKWETVNETNQEIHGNASHTFGTHPDDWDFGTAPDTNVIDGEVLQWPQIEA